MREHRIHQYDILEPDYQPTEQEQAYLNIIHDVKTTNKDADADKWTHANTDGSTHMYAERRSSKFNTRKLLSYVPSRIQMDNSR